MLQSNRALDYQYYVDVLPDIKGQGNHCAMKIGDGRHEMEMEMEMGGNGGSVVDVSVIPEVGDWTRWLSVGL